MSRDFLIGLYKLLNQKQQEYQKKGKTLKSYDIIQNSFYKQMYLLRFIEPSLYSANINKGEISPQTIRILQQYMQDKNLQLREAALNTLGTIGLPESIVAEHQFLKAL